MTIKNSEKFREWAGKSGLKGDDRMPIFTALNERPDADAILLEACPQNGTPWTVAQMSAKLGLGQTPKSQATLLPKAAPVKLFGDIGQPEDLEQGKPELKPQPARQAPAKPTSDKPTRSELLRMKKGGGKQPIPQKLEKAGGGEAPSALRPSLAEQAEPEQSPKKEGWFKFGRKSGPGKPAKAQGRRGKGKGVVGILIVVVILAALFGTGYYFYKNGLPFNIGSSGYEYSEPVVADENLTDLSPTEKALWADQVVQQNVSVDSFKNKPASISEFFLNFVEHLNWLLSVTSILFLMVSIYRERTQMGEISDVTLSNLGVAVMLVSVFLAPMVGLWATTAGWSPLPIVFRNVTLIVGFIISMLFQGVAWYTGENDLSVLAFGTYSSGTLLRWWYPTDPTISVIGMVLILLGIVIQILEVRRHNSPWRTAIVVVLMLVFFFGAYLGMHNLFQGKLDAFIITADPGAQAAAAIQISLMAKWQMGISLIVGVLSAYFGGMIAGMILLKATGSDAHYSGKDRKVLDADANSLAVMILYLLLPFIWKLPYFLKMLRSI